MKKLLALLFAVISLLLIFGCSESPTNQSTPSSVDHSIQLVQRPEFVETRPADVVAQVTFTKENVPLAVLEKKPPPPPPDDTTSGDPNPNPAHKYAYIIGISDYDGTANDLNYCDDDAMAMRSWYQSQGFTCTVDIDGQASANDIIAGLQWLVNQAAPGDEIAFCYSGHGMKTATGSAIISADLYYITDDYVMSFFNAANCSKKLITIDACVIGGFHNYVESGSFVATASDRKNSYDAPDLQQGAWTYYWLFGVQNNGLVYAEDAAPYAEDGMAAWAAQYRLRVDPKHTDRYDGDMDM